MCPVGCSIVDGWIVIPGNTELAIMFTLEKCQVVPVRNVQQPSFQVLCCLKKAKPEQVTANLGRPHEMRKINISGHVACVTHSCSSVV